MRYNKERKCQMFGFLEKFKNSFNKKEKELVSKLEEIPEITKLFAQKQFCLYPFGWAPEKLTDCKQYRDCIRACGRCRYE